MGQLFLDFWREYFKSTPFYPVLSYEIGRKEEKEEERVKRSGEIGENTNQEEEGGDYFS